jgi:hypothetical protein
MAEYGNLGNSNSDIKRKLVNTSIYVLQNYANYFDCKAESAWGDRNERLSEKYYERVKLINDTINNLKKIVKYNIYWS